MKISRLNSIEQYVLSNETVTIDELCEVFGVSKNTIRRDLNELESRGHIAKVYGGVTAVKTGDIIPVPVRTGINASNKLLIGQLAAQEVEDGDTIFVDSGSTAVCLLRNLSARKRVTIVTHSLTVMVEAAKYENLNVICLGGIFNRPTSSYVGVSTLQAISELKLTKAFMGATGVTVEAGMTNTTFLEAEIKRGVAAHSKKIILMADSSKLGSDAVITFCYLRDISTFVTDSAPPQKFEDYFRAHQIKVLHG